MIYFDNYVDTVSAVLKRTIVTDRNQNEILLEVGLQNWCDETAKLKQSNNTMFFIGNGASASMSSHMSADASKNGGFRARALNDISLLTAVSNDESYEESFSIPLMRFANTDDILVTISSSGNSPNIIKAIETARNLGVGIITLSGLNSENKSRKLGDMNFYVPGETYGVTEVSHQVILHCWLDCFMDYHKSDVGA